MESSTGSKVVYCISPIFPSEVYFYDLTTKVCKCKTLPLTKNVKGKLYEPRIMASCTMLRNYCLVSGGGHPELPEYFKESVMCHFTVEGEWKFKISQVAEMLMGKAEHSLCPISDDLILSIGGTNSKGVTSYCEAYSLAKNAWAQYMPLGVGRRQVSSCTFNGEHVYAFGGRNAKGLVVNTIEKLKIGSPKNNWRTLILFNEKSFLPLANSLVAQISEDTILIAGGTTFSSGTKTPASSHKLQESSKCQLFNARTMQFTAGPELQYGTEFSAGSATVAEGVVGAVDLQMSIHLFRVGGKEWECVKEASWNSFRFEIKSASDMTANTNSYKSLY